MGNNVNTNKIKQQIAKRKAEEEAKRKEQQAKKKKRILIIVIAAVAAVAIICAIAIPVALNNKVTYEKIELSSLDIPDSSTAAKAVSNLNEKDVEIRGYLFPCTSQYYCLCTKAVASCPYATGSIPTDSIMIKYKDGAYFNYAQNTYASVKGELVVQSENALTFEGQKTYMYMLVDTVDVISK